MRDVTSRVPLTIRATASIVEAAHLMRVCDVGEVLVTDKGRLIGVLNQREVVVLAITADAPPSSITAHEACDTAAPRLSADLPVTDALEYMRARHLRQLPVVARRGRLVGCAWLTDLEAVVATRPPTRPTSLTPLTPLTPAVLPPR